MITGEAWQPVESEVILRLCSVAVVSLQQTDYVFIEIVPPPGPRLVFRNVVLKRSGLFAELGHAEIPGENVIQSRNIGGTLNRSMAAQGHNAATRPAHVAQQELQNRGATNDLHARGVLRPTHGVANSTGFF